MRIALVIALFTVSASLPLLLRWWRMRRWGLPVRVVADPDDPRPGDICGYLAEIARRLDERPERMRVVFDGRNSADRAIALDLGADGELRVSVEGRRAKGVDLRGRWIADHPVPLPLERAVLYVDPVDGNRFRVMSGIPFAVPPYVYAASSVAATIGVVCLSPEIVFSVVGLCVGCLAATRQ